MTNINDVEMFKGKRAMFSKRFTISNKTTALTQMSLFIAKLVGEDANTAYYVREYNSGNYSSRAEYIEYMANRIEFELKKTGMK